MTLDDEEQPKTRHVRIGFATTTDGQLDAERIGTIEELPYLEAKGLVKTGRGQYVDGPDLEPPAEPAAAESVPAGPRVGNRWGDGSGTKPARPAVKSEPEPAKES